MFKIKLTSIALGIIIKTGSGNRPIIIMEFLDKDKKPLVPKVNIPQKLKTDEASLFKEKSRIYKSGWSGVEGSLYRDPKTRREITRILKIGKPFKQVTSDDIKKEIKKIEDKIDLNKDGYFTLREAKRAMRKGGWDTKREIMEKNLFDPQGRYEIEKIKAEDKLLKKKFGIK